MSAPDRSWTIAPTLVWFAAIFVGLLWAIDGDVSALADRLTAKREDTGSHPSGPTFTAPPIAVAEADDASDDATAHLPPPPAGSHDQGALIDTCVLGTADACKHWAMDGFDQAIADERAGKLGHPVRISWYGDSVVATDAIPGRLRSRIQTELGDGGPGFVYIVPPHRFNNHEAISRSSGGTWYTHAISTMQIPDGLYGPGGSTTETDGGHSTIKLVAGKITALELYYLAQPKGGIATVAADGAEVVHVDTGGDAKQAMWAPAAIPNGAAKLEVKTDHRVRLFGIDLENARGAVVDNLGVVSVNVKSFANNDGAHWQTELAHRSSDLVMIMIGANEAEWLGPNDKDTKDYQQHYETVLAVIRKARPDASCLVVSPTDQAEAKDGEYPSRPVMPVLVEAQRKAAQAQGCAFYSTYAWMGGRGSAATWFKKGLVGSDFQHLSKRGADKMADAVFDALMAGSRRYAGN